MTVTTMPALMLAAAADNGGGGLFAVEPGVALWTIIIFLGVLLVLGRFAWGPILGALDAREDRIRSSIEEARGMREESARLLEEHKRQIADARRQAQEIVAEGREAGERIRREVEATARQSAEDMLARAREGIQRERDQAIIVLREATVDLAMAAASKLLEQRLDSAADRELVQEFLDDMETEGPGGLSAEA
jgi:F-type H+-transporting ATPase subunit b